jgi:hypothetical protein
MKSIAPREMQNNPIPSNKMVTSRSISPNIERTMLATDMANATANKIISPNLYFSSLARFYSNSKLS